MQKLKFYRSEQWEYSAYSEEYDVEGIASSEYVAEIKLLRQIIQKLENKLKDKFPEDYI